jgi:hypothetical protein
MKPTERMKVNFRLISYSKGKGKGKGKVVLVLN